MNRREAILSTSSVFVSASLGAIACGAQKAVAGATAGPQPVAAPSSDVAEASLQCVRTGLACKAHCVAMLTTGDTSMAACLRTVTEMLSLSEALAELASSGSPRTAALAKVSLDACRDCEAECRKHAGHHDVCKNCADACARTIAILSKLS
jgi:Cys-rich four helix bundle protein (predicted Tat secretion target)